MDINIGKEDAKNQRLAILEEDKDGMSVPNWLVDVLKWITRIEMANSSLSFSCKLFKQLCLPKLHENVKPHFVPGLAFDCEPNTFGGICRKFKDRQWQIIPIAAIPPPEYIRGFEGIIIRYLDTQIIEFLKNIALEEIYLLLHKCQMNEEELMLTRNLLTILANNINRLKISNFRDANCLLDFNRQFSTFIEQMPYLFVVNIVDFDFDILFNWLMKPLKDGRQKILYYHINSALNVEKSRKMEIQFLNRIKEEFLQSTGGRNFLIQLLHEYERFILQNKQTEEVLNLYHERNVDGVIHTFIARHPKGEEHWKEGSLGKICGNGKTLISLEL